MSGRGAAAERNINPAAGQRPLPLDCCGGLNNVDYSKMDLKPLDEFLKLINIRDSSFCIAVIAIIFNPVFWNVVARWEHSTRKLTRLFGSPYVACYCLAFVIILLNVYRSHRCSSSSSSYSCLCPLFCIGQCRPPPAFVQHPLEVHTPTHPTMDQNGDKAPSTQSHKCTVRQCKIMFFSRRISVMSVAGQQHIGNKLLLSKS